MTRWRLVALLIVLAGCGDQGVGSDDPIDREQPSATASAPSTAKATASADRAALERLEEQYLQWRDELLAALNEVDAAFADDFPDIAVGMAGLGLMVAASDEREALREQLPEACFQEAWQTYNEAVDLYYSIGSDLSSASTDAISRNEPLDADTVTRSQQLNDVATELMAETMTLLSAADC